MSVLFEPINIGELTLGNRIIMSPLTRARSGGERVPNALMAEYYAQRASAGLIISEATSVCPMGIGYANTPGIWSEEQVEGWKLVTNAVHENHGKIVLQLWHVGRISDPLFLNGELPVAPSAVKPAGHVSLVRPEKAYETPRALDINEIPSIIEAYRQGAENAKKAGFDGVEIHGANGYLLDQFLQDKTNKREDIYGGSIENRARLMLQVTDAVISVWGSGRVGMHLAPRCDAHDMGDSDPLSTFSYVVKALSQRKIAFICARERQGDGYIGDKLKEIFDGVYIANQGLMKEEAEQLIETKKADAIAWGQLFIANPDLPKRLLLNSNLNKPNPTTFYTHGSEGYTDYPMLDEGK
jgi:2,4-dienoyl-CoA reductase-like NADH-dependent reductase (Old Yellow Enzyme family)